MADLDLGGKVILQTRPADLVRLVAPGFRRRLHPLNAEVVKAVAIADGVFSAGRGAEMELYQLEFVAAPGSRTGRDVLRRACLLFAAHLRPVHIVVVYMHPAADDRRGPEAFHLPIGRAPVPVELEVVRLWEDLDAAEVLQRPRPPLGLLPLVGLMRGATLGAVARAAAAICKHARTSGQRADLLAALRLLSAWAFNDRELNGIITLEAIMKASPTVKSILEQARAQAAAEGRAEGQRELLLRQLHVRFRALPQRVIDRVGAAQPDAIAVWSERVLTAASLDEVFSD